MTVDPQRTLRGHDFWPPADVLATIPALVATDGVRAGDKAVPAHYFAGGHDWYIVELDPATGEAFGFVTSRDCPDGELGYIDMNELARLHVQLPAHHAADGTRVGAVSVVVERDLDWTPTRLGQIAPRLDERRRPVTTPAVTAPAPAAPLASPSRASMNDGLGL